jgi:hypothetical protein
MSPCRALRVLGLLALLAADLPAEAQDVVLSLQYEVRYGPLTLLSMRVTTDLERSRYRSRVHTQTEGIAGLMFPWESQTEAVGVRDGRVLRPHHLRSAGTYRSQRRVVEIDYDADGSVRSRVEPPPDGDWRDAVPPAMQQATIDPITAGMHTVVSGECRGTLPVFDGRRRYDLRLEVLEDAELPPSRHRVYAGPTRRCRAQVEALGGFWRVDPRDGEQPTFLDMWIAAPRTDLPRVPVYLELTGARGTLRIHLADVERLPSSPPG